MGTVIGLDIGTHAVRAVELSMGRGRPLLRRMGQVALPPGAVVTGEVVDAPAVSSALRRLWREVGFTSRSVVVGVANPRVVARIADLPDLPENELRSSLRFQVQDLIPIPVDEAELDFQIVERVTTEDGTNLTRVLLVAAHQDMLRSLLAALEGADLDAVRVDLIPFALIRAIHDPVAWLDPSSPIGGHEVVIGVGAGVTNVVVHENGLPRFVRTLPTGGALITDALTQELQVSAEEAETAKRRILVPAGVDAAHVDDVATAALMPLVNEVAGSLDFHVAQTGGSDLRQLVLCGGGSRLPTLQRLLQNQLSVPVVAANPYAGLDVSKVPIEQVVVASSADLFTVAIGLALSGEPLPGDGRRISLLPTEVLERRAAKRQKVLVSAGAGAFVAVLLGLGYLRGGQVADARADAEDAEARLASLQASVSALNDVEAMQTDIATRSATVTQVLQGDVAWTALFRNIAAVMPDDVWLESMNVSRDMLTGTGKMTVAGIGLDQTSVARWIIRTSDLDSLDNVWVSSAAKKDVGGQNVVSFSSTADITGAAASDRSSNYTEDAR